MIIPPGAYQVNKFCSGQLQTHIVGGKGIRIVRADKFYPENDESQLHLVFVKCKDILLFRQGGIFRTF